MHLSNHDLRQLDFERLRALTNAQLRAVAETLLLDLKAARERLNPNAGKQLPTAEQPSAWERGCEEDTGLEDAPVTDGAEEPGQDRPVADAETDAHVFPAETEAEPEADAGNSGIF